MNRRRAFLGFANNFQIITNGAVLLLDAGNPASYSGTGNTWYDIDGNTPTLDFSMSGQSFVTNWGGALLFNSTSYTCLRSHHTSFSPSTTDNFTINLWIRMTSIPTQSVPIHKGAVNNLDWAFYISTVQSIAFYKRNNAGVNENVSFGGNGISATVPLNEWRNYCTVLQSGTCANYVNGILTRSHNFADTQIRVTSNRLALGYGFGGYFRGYQTHCGIYNRPLSAFEVFQNYMAVKTRLGI